MPLDAGTAISIPIVEGFVKKCNFHRESLKTVLKKNAKNPSGADLSKWRDDSLWVLNYVTRTQQLAPIASSAWAYSFLRETNQGMSTIGARLCSICAGFCDGYICCGGVVMMSSRPLRAHSQRNPREPPGSLL